MPTFFLARAIAAAAAAPALAASETRVPALRQGHAKEQRTRRCRRVTQAEEVYRTHDKHATGVGIDRLRQRAAAAECKRDGADEHAVEEVRVGVGPKWRRSVRLLVRQEPAAEVARRHCRRRGACVPLALHDFEGADGT